jgi:PhnB protein
MSQKMKTIPDGYHTVTPYLIVKDGSQAIKFYEKAFHAQEIFRQDTPDGKILHATFKIGDSIIMLSDEFPEHHGHKIMAPNSLKATTAMLHLYVEDVDASFNHAVKMGAKVLMPVGDMFWGDRYGQLEDPFGHCWSLATHKENATTQNVTAQENKQSAKSCCSA